MNKNMNTQQINLTGKDLDNFSNFIYKDDKEFDKEEKVNLKEEKKETLHQKTYHQDNKFEKL